jgi:hypothetical protein
MSVRLSAVALLTGLALAAPAYAEVDLLTPEQFLDAQETETAALIAVDLAMLQGPASTTPLGLVQPVSMAEASTSDQADLLSEPAAPANPVRLTPAGGHGEEASLAPDFFLDSHQDETFARIAGELASAGELTTGTLARGSAEAAPLVAEQYLNHALTDDALPFEEYLLP